ncbi:MAG: transketolase family protein [Bacillota bacterium]
MTNSGTACRRAFTDTLLALARKDPGIVAVTSDARGSVTLEKFARELPGQFVETGIAEQNAVGIAAGLAACGKKPFLCGPASFLSARSLEQIKVDVAYAQTNVKLIGVSGGLSYGALGLTHHSLHDLAVMRAIPGLAVVLPCDARQTARMTEFLAAHDGPVYVRMGRNAVCDVYCDSQVPFQLGKANILMEGDDITLIGAGETVRCTLDAGLILFKRGIGARVLDLHTIKPLDGEAVLKAAAETGGIITVEEHSVYGGLGAAIAELICQRLPVPLKILGIPDEPPIAGTSPEVFGYYGLDADNIAGAALSMLRRRKRSGTDDE